jgi:hypothetical protein
MGGGMKLRLELRVADAILKQVSYFNGWKVAEESEYEACLRAARNVIRIVRAEDKKKESV